MHKTLGAFFVGLVLTAAPAFAHHPFAPEYDWKKPMTVAGTITKVEWMEPHVQLTINGKDASGSTASWVVEMGSPDELSKFGWAKSTLKQGDSLAVDGWLASDGSKRINAKSVRLSSGREMFAASSFFDVALTAEAAATSGSRSGAASPKATSGTTTRPEKR
jgi:hypothetical protein